MTTDAWAFVDTGSVSVDLSRCAKCGASGATEAYVGESGTFGYSHGIYQHWCHRCILTAQIAYAETIAARLPAMRAELENLP